MSHLDPSEQQFNPSLQQAIIATINQYLVKQGYQSNVLIRLSCETYLKNSIAYQGLSKVSVCHAGESEKRFVKWQLKAGNSISNTTLDTEICTIKQLQQLQQKAAANNYLDLIAYKLLQPSTLKAIDMVWQLNGLVMPYFSLGSVKDFLQNNQLTNSSKLQLLINIAKSIQQTHQSGWVHGDIKPSNILLAIPSEIQVEKKQSGELRSKVVNKQNSANRSDNISPKAYLNDWAYARSIKLSNQDIEQRALIQKKVNKNKRVANIRGTPAYLAPECWHGQPLSIQSDLYAFGITCFELIAGEKPFNNKTSNEVIYDVDRNSEKVSATTWAKLHCQQPTPMLPNLEQNKEQKLQPIIDKLLAKHSYNRYKNIAEVIQQLEVLKKY